MPLSEEELRQLEQMERALVAEDPKFASTLRGTKLRRNARRRSYVAAGVFVVGVVVLMAGAVTQHTIVGIVGFVVMLVSAYVALVSWRGQHAAGEEEASAGEQQSPSGSGFSVVEGGKANKKKRSSRGGRGGSGRTRKNESMMQRLEERWRRRRDESGGF